MYSSLQSSFKPQFTYSNYAPFHQWGVGLLSAKGRNVFPITLSWAWVLDILRYLVGILPPQDSINRPYEIQYFLGNADPHCQRTHS